MSTKKSWMLGLLLAGGLSLAANPPVAMRVEVEPLQKVGGMTEVAVVIQVSPEDRLRIGSNAIVRIELDGGKVSSGSPMRAVRLEDDGSVRIAVAWPPGEFHLRVEIEDPNKEDTGLWVGTVRIPDLGPDANVKEIDEPKPVPVPVPVPVPDAADPVTPSPDDSKNAPEEIAAAAAAASPEKPPGPEPVPVPDDPDPVTAPSDALENAPEDTVATASALASDPTPVADPSSETGPAVEELGDAEVVAEATPDPPAPDVPAAIGTAAVGAAALPAVSEPLVEEKPLIIEEPEPEPVAQAESVPVEPVTEEPEPPIDEPEMDDVISDAEPAIPAAEDVAEAPQIEEPVEIEEVPPIVEPLRADPPPQIDEPEAVAPRQAAESVPAAVAVSAELAARYEEWGSVDPEIREFSVIATHGREPAMDLETESFQLRVGGSRVPVEAVGSAKNAPLLLGLAINVATDEVENWSGMQGSLRPIVGRAGGGRGRLFVSTPAGVGAWDADMDAPGGVTLAQSPENVARLVTASIERFSGMHGRTFLVVLTGGRNEPAKKEWQQATDAAGAAGVPILVIALWDDDLNNRTRKNLKKLTEVSGGSLFLVQGRAQLESAADRFGRYLDGGYSLRFRSPVGDGQKLTTISVSVSDKELDVSAPKTIR